MVDPKELTTEELLQGVHETQEALQGGRELIERAGSVKLVGVKLVGSTLKLMDELERELADFETEIEARAARP